MGILESWKRYVHNEVNEFSKTTEWRSAQVQNAELMDLIPAGVKYVLDLGAGDGWTTNELIRRGYIAKGVTINPKEAEHAKRVYGVELLVEDAHALDSLRDKAFDCVYCRECLEHCVAPFLVMCEINRVLVSGGYALIHMPNATWIREDSHHNVYDEAQMRELLRKTLFEVTSIGTTAVGMFYLAHKVGEVV
jgi:SAM-dependent methyltransferase